MPFLGGRSSAARGFFGAGSVPDAPTGLSSTPGNGQLSIAFTPPVFNGGLPITNYEWSVNAGSTWTAVSPVDITSPVTIGPLTNGTAYTVYLRAVNALGGGKTSAALSTNTTPFTGPNAPTSLVSTPGNGELSIAFTAPTNNGGYPITNYQYATSTNSGVSYGAWTSLSPVDTTSPVTIPSLTNGTAYYVKLRAITSVANGDESAAVTTGTTPRTTPSITLDAATNFNQNRATLNSTVTSNGGSAITSVTFQYYKDGDAWTDATAVETSAGSNIWYANITSLTEAKIYTFRVKATNAAGTTTTGTSTFTTWSLKTAIVSTVNDSFTVPTITPRGGTRINPSIYEVVTFGGGGTGGTYGAAGGGAGYRNDASIEVTQSAGTIAWTIGATGGGTTRITGLSGGNYDAPGGGNGSNETPGESGPQGGFFPPMQTGGSGNSGQSPYTAGGSIYEAEGKNEGYAYGGGGGAGGYGETAYYTYSIPSAVGGYGGDGVTLYGIEGGGGAGGGGGGGYGIVYGANGAYRTYGGGGGVTATATAGVVRFRYYGA